MTTCGSCTADVRSSMFRTFLPVSPDMNSIYVTWRKSFRKIQNVSPRTHCRTLRHLVESSCLQFDLMSRFLSFYDSISKSNNECTRFCSLLCKSSRSAENRIMLLSYFNKMELCEIETTMLQICFHHKEIYKDERR